MVQEGEGRCKIIIIRVGWKSTKASLKYTLARSRLTEGDWVRKESQCELDLYGIWQTVEGFRALCPDFERLQIEKALLKQLKLTFTMDIINNHVITMKIWVHLAVPFLQRPPNGRDSGENQASKYYMPCSLSSH